MNKSPLRLGIALRGVGSAALRRHQPPRNRAGDVSGQSVERGAVPRRRCLGVLCGGRPGNRDRRRDRGRRRHADGTMAARRRDVVACRPLRLQRRARRPRARHLHRAESAALGLRGFGCRRIGRRHAGHRACDQALGRRLDGTVRADHLAAVAGHVRFRGTRRDSVAGGAMSLRHSNRSPRPGLASAISHGG